MRAQPNRHMVNQVCRWVILLVVDSPVVAPVYYLSFVLGVGPQAEGKLPRQERMVDSRNVVEEARFEC